VLARRRLRKARGVFLIARLPKSIPLILLYIVAGCANDRDASYINRN
jgi:hypothetical protein